jgi:hypothetical protein
VRIRAKYGPKIACFVRITPSDVRITPSDVQKHPSDVGMCEKIYINKIAKITFEQGRTPPL